MLALCLALLLAAPPPDDFPATITAALLRLKQADAREPTLTRFELAHSWNIKANGQRFAENTKLYEQTWINGLAYKRLVEYNGKPLKPDDLALEQKRYDQFVADHKALDQAERARIEHAKLLHTTLDFARLQTSAYRITQLRAEQCIGRPCHVYLAEPNPGEKPDPTAQPYTYQLWITDADPLLTRLKFSLPANATDSDHQTTGTMEWELFNGQPVESHTLYSAYTRFKGQDLQVQVDTFFTRYRRFATTSTLLPAEPGQTQPNPQ